MRVRLHVSTQAFTHYCKSRAGNVLEFDDRRDVRAAKEVVAAAVHRLQPGGIQQVLLQAAAGKPRVPWLVLEWSRA